MERRVASRGQECHALMSGGRGEDRIQRLLAGKLAPPQLLDTTETLGFAAAVASATYKSKPASELAS